MNKRLVYGILGGGVMGRVIFSLIRHTDPSAQIIVCVRDRKDAVLWQKHAVEVVYDGDVTAADVVLLAVKPRDFREAEVAVSPSALVVSVMAGVSVASIRKKLGAPSVARIMMNIAAEHGHSLAVWYAPCLDNDNRERVRAICIASGEALEVASEDAIDQSTVVLGSGPAFMLHTLELMTDAARDIGVPRDSAIKMARAAFGAAHLIISKGPSIGIKELITRIASKGGTTEAGLCVLETTDQRAVWVEASHAAYRRAKELQVTASLQAD